MVNYIKQIAQEMGKAVSPTRIDASAIFGLSKALAEELDRLDPRDFLPAAQFEFVRLRISARDYAGKTSFGGDDYRPLADCVNRIIAVLDQYAGMGSYVTTRSFAFIRDAGLRGIVERDYRELSLIVLPGGAWKSTVIMAGSIVEAILFDQLAAPAVKASAEASPKAPKRSDGTPRDLSSNTSKDKWTLENLIDVAVDLKILPQERAKTFDQVLRDYRNFVHPKKELRSAHPCTEAEAFMAKGALDGLCNHLTP